MWQRVLRFGLGFIAFIPLATISSAFVLGAFIELLTPWGVRSQSTEVGAMPKC
jgi:hypothetical protein